MRFILSARSPHRLGFHPFLSLWIVKLKNLPVPGSMIDKKDYDGIIFNLRFPIFAGTMYQKSFTVAQLIGWDRKPMPKWIPEWALMKEGVPRPGLIKFLTDIHAIRYPVSIKFI